MRGRSLQPGDMALTDFNGPGPLTRVKILDRRQFRGSQSGISFRIYPFLKGGSADTWYDADWFEPAPSGAANGPRD